MNALPHRYAVIPGSDAWEGTYMINTALKKLNHSIVKAGWDIVEEQKTA